MVFGDWKFGFYRYDYDDEVMLYGSGDIREDVSIEGDVDDM